MFPFLIVFEKVFNPVRSCHCFGDKFNHFSLLLHCFGHSCHGLLSVISTELTPVIECIFPLKSPVITWLVVSTPLNNISQLGWLFPIYGKIKFMFQTTNQWWLTYWKWWFVIPAWNNQKVFPRPNLRHGRGRRQHCETWWRCHGSEILGVGLKLQGHPGKNAMEIVWKSREHTIEILEMRWK